MPTRARVGPGWSQELEAQPSSPTQVAGIQLAEPSAGLSALAASCSQEPNLGMRGVGRGLFTTGLNACFLSPLCLMLFLVVKQITTNLS